MDLLDAYKKMFTVRWAEEAIARHYMEDGMKTPMHMSKGEEGIVAGVLGAAGEEALTLGTYRTHALYLVKTGDMEGFFAEMYGKVTGRVKGKGGSMHLIAPEKGLIGTSAIVGSCLPLAAGAAFADRLRKIDRVVVVFFGDGAVDEGVFWETINSACLMKLRVLFVYEDNGLAVHTPASIRHGYESLSSIIKEFNCEVSSCDGYDVSEVFGVTDKLLSRMKSRGSPGFLACKYFRFLEHVGVLEDFKSGYRPRPTDEELRNMDPLLRCRISLLRAMPEGDVIKMEEGICAQGKMALQAAMDAPFPESDVAFEDLLA